MKLTPERLHFANSCRHVPVPTVLKWESAICKHQNAQNLVKDFPMLQLSKVCYSSNVIVHFRKRRKRWSHFHNVRITPRHSKWEDVWTSQIIFWTNYPRIEWSCKSIHFILYTSTLFMIETINVCLLVWHLKKSQKGHSIVV